MSWVDLSVGTVLSLASGFRDWSGVRSGVETDTSMLLEFRRRACWQGFFVYYGRGLTKASAGVDAGKAPAYVWCGHQGVPWLRAPSRGALVRLHPGVFLPASSVLFCGGAWHWVRGVSSCLEAAGLALVSKCACGFRTWSIPPVQTGAHLYTPSYLYMVYIPCE